MFFELCPWAYEIYFLCLYWGWTSCEECHLKKHSEWLDLKWCEVDLLQSFTKRRESHLTSYGVR